MSKVSIAVSSTSLSSSSESEGRTPTPVTDHEGTADSHHSKPQPVLLKKPTQAANKAANTTVATNTTTGNNNDGTVVITTPTRNGSSRSPSSAPLTLSPLRLRPLKTDSSDELQDDVIGGVDSLDSNDDSSTGPRTLTKKKSSFRLCGHELTVTLIRETAIPPAIGRVHGRHVTRLDVSGGTLSDFSGLAQFTSLRTWLPSLL